MEGATRVLYLWQRPSSYMGACWRTLDALPDIDVRAVCIPSPSFGSEVLGGVAHDLVDTSHAAAVADLRSILGDYRPQVVVVSGWRTRAYRAAARRLTNEGVPLVLTLDNPWAGGPRQRFGRFVLGRYLRSFSAVVVPGERAAVLASHLGFEPQQIWRGLYGIDTSTFAASESSSRNETVNRFLFVGRYEDVKGLDLLVRGYALYRERSDNPWPLDCFGEGSRAALLRDRPGISDRGFCPPGRIAGEMASSSGFVLASRYDPWPLVLAESCAAGLPVVCTTACGSAVELVRPFFNGYLAGAGSPSSIADGLLWVESQRHNLPELGRRSRALVAPYDVSFWAARQRALIRSLIA